MTDEPITIQSVRFSNPVWDEITEELRERGLIGKHEYVVSMDINVQVEEEITVSNVKTVSPPDYE